MWLICRARRHAALDARSADWFRVLTLQRTTPAGDRAVHEGAAGQMPGRGSCARTFHALPQASRRKTQVAVRNERECGAQPSVQVVHSSAVWIASPPPLDRAPSPLGSPGCGYGSPRPWTGPSTDLMPPATASSPRVLHCGVSRSGKVRLSGGRSCITSGRYTIGNGSKRPIIDWVYWF